jgi:hypothetical protein
MDRRHGVLRRDEPGVVVFFENLRVERLREKLFDRAYDVSKSAPGREPERAVA